MAGQSSMMGVAATSATSSYRTTGHGIYSIHQALMMEVRMSLCMTWTGMEEGNGRQQGQTQEASRLQMNLSPLLLTLQTCASTYNSYTCSMQSLMHRKTVLAIAYTSYCMSHIQERGIS